MSRLSSYQPPFPWFGGKSAIAHKVWEAFGADIPNVVEPFCGSCAVLLLRPGGAGHIETVNDADGLLANFWRSLRNNPDAVAEAADNPVNEADLHSRHLWLLGEKSRITERLMGDHDFFDAKAAGYWAWGQCCWIGSGWCSGRGPWQSVEGVMTNTNAKENGVWAQRPHLGNSGQGVNRQRPHLSNSGQGVNRQRPHLGDSGKGVNRQLPHLGDPGKASTGNGVSRKRPELRQERGGSGVLRNPPANGVWRQRADTRGVVTMASDLGACAERREWLIGYLRGFADRLRGVRVCCGDWSRVCGPSVTFRHGMTGVFLDPPYADTANRTKGLYANDCDQVAHAAREWAIEQGRNPLMRIVLAGYQDEHQMPSDWRVEEWEAVGGYGLISADEESTGRANRGRERLWMSPACLTAVPNQGVLFPAGGAT